MKSYYLDDMEVEVGDYVVCKSDMCGTGFTPGEIYRVLEGKTVWNNRNRRVRPSARFSYCSVGG